MATTKELNEAVNEYQNTEQTAIKESQKASEYKPFTIQLPKIGTVAERMHAMDLQAPLTEDYTQEAVASGFGTSRYDNEFYPGKDLEHNRALEQSAFAKIGLGLAKGGVTTAATAVNTTLGVLFGVGSALYELAADTNGNGAGFMDTLDAGVNNWLSNQLVALQNWSETAMPNYRTAEERSEKYQKEWIKHMGTANFIGDSLLKNFGFTLGAMGGGVVWSKILSRGMTKFLANNVMKGAVAAAAGDAEISSILRGAAAALEGGSAKGAQAALGRAAQAVGRETAVAADYTQIANNIKQAARGINKMNARLQLYGAAIGAMGEGVVEGVMARNEFMEDYTAKLNRKFAEEYRNVERDILNSGNKYWAATRVMQSPDGGIYDEQFLTEAGQKHVEYLRKGLTEHYANEKEFAEEQGRRLASTTYLLNLPVLTASNLVQFGRLFSGGWSTARKNLVKGGIREASGNLMGAYTNKGGSIAAKGALGSVKDALSEAFEEMAQGAASSGSQQVASYRLADFNDQGYDDEATHSVKAWVENMYAGGKEYLGDIKNWQEGALGALTGLLGIPGRRWHGGVIGAIQDSSEEINASREAANTLNNLVNSKEFQDKWRGYIRHLKYDNDMESAIIKDDEYAWHTADKKQLVSDVIAFASAGRLDDLKQVADHFAGITESDAQSIRDVQKQDGNAEDWTRNLSDAEIVGKVKKQADRMKTAIDDYAELYDAIKTRAPMNASDEFINEMVFSAMHIKQSDRRFLELFGEVFGEIEPYLHVVATAKVAAEASTASERATERIQSEAEAFTALRDDYEALFAGALLPFRMPKKIQEAMDMAFGRLDEMTKDDKDLNKKVNDLKKISEDRQQFFKKLQTLRENKVMDDGRTAQESFEQERMTQEKQDIKAEQEFAEEETKGLDTFADIQQAYHSKNARDKVGFLDSLRAVADKNRKAKKFLDLKQRWDGFNEYLNTKYLAGKRLPFDSQSVAFMVNGMLRLAKSEEELINVPDNLFPSYDEFILANRRVVMGVEMTPSMEAYAQIKQTIRDAMGEYLDTESRTASRKSIKLDNLKKTKKDASVPEGPDKPQPASVTPSPKRRQEQKSEEQKSEEQKPEEQKSEEQKPEEQKPEEEQTYVVVDNPTESDLNAFATASLADDKEIGSSLVTPPGGGRKVGAYYRTSMPEVPSRTNEQRAQILAQKDKVADVDLRDFAVVNPAFAEQWNALNSVHGFDNIVTVLETGDEIEFVIDPAYPKYNETPQILLAVEKTIEGEKVRKYLNVLSSQTSKYYGLGELREAIYKEYKEFIEKHPNQLFVFSKKSHCWLKRHGLVDYDRTIAGRDVRDIPNFDPDAPIGYIDSKGKLKLIRGNEQVEWSLERELHPYRFKGLLFYFAKTDRDKYCPIGLGIEHFKTNNMIDRNAIFDMIRESLFKIARFVKEATLENLNEQDQKLRKELQHLGEYLNIRDVFFKIGDYRNIGIALKIIYNYRSKAQKAKDAANGVQAPEEKSVFLRVDQISEYKLTTAIARLGLSINVKVPKENNSNDSIPHFDEFFNAGMITSNARMLRPKGMDFYFDAYNPETGQFEKMTADQLQAEQELKRQAAEKANEQSDETGYDSAEGVNSDDLFGDRKEGLKLLEPEVKKSEERGQDKKSVDEPVPSTEQTQDGVKMTEGTRRAPEYAELTKEQQAVLQKKGYDEEMFNALDDKSRNQKLECLYV